ncbi:methyltransferase domain-containing protein [Plantactinospora sp. GCM10030261]|uniref:class I SAM-dependent methyltransferase n=1 Tax=Plantactinospora sp. GCM10030261 TaxID=3273420 RepID=UPI00360921C1
MRCPACDSPDLAPVADLGPVPALCGVTWARRDEAVSSPAGPMVLRHCPACAHVVNVAFRPGLLEYDGTYDNNLHHSPTFREYVRGLARRLDADHRLAGRTVLELGCGKGDFLRELAAVSGCRGVGYDASFEGDVGADDDLTFVRGFLPLDGTHPTDLAPDFLVTRHVLEHLEDPYAFLVGLRGLADDRPVRGYFEVPNASYDFATAGWDCIYPHVSYFNAESLRRMVERAGFQVTRVSTSFSDIFLSVEVAANPSEPVGTVAVDAGVVRRQLAKLGDFAVRYAETVSTWRSTIARLSAEGANPVLWGAGARGVAFLSAVDGPTAGSAVDGQAVNRSGAGSGVDRPGVTPRVDHARLSGVIDLNPNKWGRYLPVTGHRISAPDEIVAMKCRCVIITNPAYRDEIGERLRRMGVDADILVA